ncbi:MAG TPA: hypothetical protein VN711_02480 [Candidatus Saccharimonadales bacterium]|nr:hypothetical protein [Candidatus Saccharimonadales bacterium]
MAGPERLTGDPRKIIPPLLQQGRRLRGRFPRALLRLVNVDTKEFSGVRVIRRMGGQEEELGLWGFDRMDGEDVKITRHERDSVVRMAGSVVRPFWDKLEKTES